MELQYNKNNKRIHIEDYQHPADKIATEAVTKLPIFQKMLEYISKNTIEKSYKFINDSCRMKITEEMSPKLFTMIREAMEMFEVDKTPKLYVERNYEYVIYLKGIEDPYIILPSSIMESYDDDLMWSLIASEISGIKSNHSSIRFIEEIVNIAKPAFPFVIDAAWTLAYNQWFRSMQYSYDRAALLASEDFGIVVKQMFYMENNKDIFDNIDFSKPDNDYYKQACEFLQRQGSAGLYQKVYTVFADYQWQASRYVELYNWYFSGEYDEVLERCKNR